MNLSNKSGSAIVVIGAQVGDEGKGKIVDLFAERVDMVVRYGGGANAGHTLMVNGKKTVTHLLPSGIIRNGMLCFLGSGVACDMDVLVEELGIALACGSHVQVDRRASVVHPFHKLQDQISELARGKKKRGTTIRGIGPCYADRAARTSLKLGDLTNREKIATFFRSDNYYAKKCAILACDLATLSDEARTQINIPSFEELVEWCWKYSECVKPLLGDTRAIVQERLHRGERVLFEGGQGMILDVESGTDPFTTSSLCSAAGVSSTFGIYQPEKVIGVAKAYLTRVGAGPFPTELHGELGDRIRELGGEYGATTGRPRRCGWMDLVALNYACRMGGVTELAITKMDKLGELDSFSVCDGYEFEGRAIGPYETITTRVQDEAVPSYQTFPIDERIKECHKVSDLPLWSRNYLDLIHAKTGIPISAIGIGQERDAIILI